MFDERRFLPEIARLVFIWRQHGAAPASAEVLCHWASAAVAWTRTPPRPMEAINSLRLSETLIEPNPPDVAYYEEQFQTVYKQIYPSLRDINHRTFDLQQKVAAAQ